MAGAENCAGCGRFIPRFMGWCEECWAKEVVAATYAPDPFLWSIADDGFEEGVSNGDH